MTSDIVYSIIISMIGEGKAWYQTPAYFALLNEKYNYSYIKKKRTTTAL